MPIRELMLRSRSVALVAGLCFSAIGILHCSAPEVTQAPTPTNTKTPSTNDNTDNTDTVKPQSTGTKKTTTPVRADASTTTTPPKVTKTSDGGTTTTANAGPGPTCKQLSTCCSKLSNSLEQVGCLLATGKQNELVCAGALVTFSCSSAGTQAAASHGPSCAGLTDGALYCGNDGPGGDPKTLYRCNGDTVAIASQCANGCTTNDGVDDACTAGGGTTTTGKGASCDGLSGDFCGTDFVGGDANTLYSCDGTNTAPTSTTVCANGCNTTTDGSFDTCSTTAVNVGDNPCSGLPDFSYCGGDGVVGNANTLYTCSGGNLSNTQICANGCTVGASNVSDFCSFTAGGTAASCDGLADGFYCGTNGPMGDPNTLYSCVDGFIDDSTSCDLGCFAGDFGGSDSCN